MAGAQAARRPETSAYRLRPLTGYGPPGARRAKPPVRRRPILRLPARPRTMALTFDDGPDPRYTPQVLRVLREHDILATFFVCGQMAVDHKGLLREMADEGHVIGNHTWTHPQLLQTSRADARAEMERTSEVIEDATGTPPEWFRAPYGAWNRAIFELGAHMNMEPMGWTVDSLDWRTPGTSIVVERVLKGAGPGVVVLAHDAGGDRTQTVRALRRYLPRLIDKGYHFTQPRRQDF
ncbi:polysaccharide deacetylase family protein [Streptomyces tsukubensis]|uniref:polysaccharide deacetylase family protein n=1 Tax=Streptomyces tsukubensis TaxID=83656 RepID=UPI00277B49D7|nr:polysaccharide deacetylase family protein [Streptomyces tsukubensis]